MWATLILLLLVFHCYYYPTSGMTFDGACPTISELDNEPNFSCSKTIGNWEANYAPLAHLPVDPGIVSLFQNAWDIQCMFLNFRCQNTKDSLVSVEQICHEKYDPYGDNKCQRSSDAQACLPIVYDTKAVRASSQVRSFGLIFANMCPEKMGNFTIHTLVRKKYLVIYGCMEKGDLGQHEESMWILVKDDAIVSFTDSFYEDLVDNVLAELPGLSATKTNFQTVNFRERESFDGLLVRPFMSHFIRFSFCLYVRCMHHDQQVSFRSDSG